MAEPPTPVPLPRLAPGPRTPARLLLVLLCVFAVLLLVRLSTSAASLLLDALLVVSGAWLIALVVPLILTIIREHFLWSLRNKLILTYLLIGLAPAVLLITLVGISAYIAAGQFSIHLADTRIHQELDQMGEDDSARIGRIAHFVELQREGQLGPPPRRGARPGSRPESTTTAPAAEPTPAETAEASVYSAVSLPNPFRARLRRHTSLFLNGAPLRDVPGASPPAEPGQTPLGLPAWASDLHGREFRSLVLDGDDLFLVAVDQRRLEHNGGTLTMVTSLPVDPNFVDVVAEGLGRVRLAALMTNRPLTPVARSTRRPSLGSEIQRTSIAGGVEPDPVNFCDLRVPFVSTVDITDWDTGQPDNVPIEVRSRPSLLYRQLFGASLGGIVTSYIRNGLIVLTILFACIEALALWMALRVSRSITASVWGLYQATRHVDQGDLAHRIPLAIAVQHDQLGELARSFNRMTGSLERLLLEQKEKERLQSELSIAQEVQANLFPHQARNLPTLELHGICRPARSVSGDYYDFLIFHHRENDASVAPSSSNGHARESGVGILLGDISGKGISAALLMATLHSAVRAYRFASEDLVYTENSFAGIGLVQDGPSGDTGKLFQSPGRILALLNRHLYRSTQPEKYATLFLGHYDAATSELTYSNAGQLPPFILGRDNQVRRLDCGGTVVGLMDNMAYEEDRVKMNSGDILIAYSDGVTEPENDFGDFGETRLLEVVARYRDQPLHIISAQVMLALDAWIGSAEQPDDITLVLARQL